MAEKLTRVKDVGAFLRAGNLIKGKHNFSRRALHWPYCGNCGLLRLKNEATKKAIAAPCVHYAD